MKRVIVLLTLLVPVILFLFLKFFGENKYSVPVYFSEGAQAISSDCQDAPPGYRIECIPFISGQDGNCDTTIFLNKITFVSIIDTSDADARQVHDSNVSRILSDIDSPGNLQSLNIYIDHGSSSAGSSSETIKKNIRTFSGSAEQVSHFARCVLFLPDKNDLFSSWTLVDTEGRIQGFYNYRSFEEIDRLMLEIKILRNDMNAEDEK